MVYDVNEINKRQQEFREQCKLCKYAGRRRENPQAPCDLDGKRKCSIAKSKFAPMEKGAE